MTTVPTTETEPAQEPFVRFAAFRGKVPLPWATVFVLAIVMAAADGFILTSLQGAVGAIERAQGPFVSWLRDTAIILPVFVVAVMWAFTRAHRKHGLTSPAMRSWRRVVTTALLIVAAGTAVGIAETTVSAAMDYRLQSQLLQRTSALHDHTIGGSNGSAVANPAYSDGSWSPEQRQTWTPPSATSPAMISCPDCLRPSHRTLTRGWAPVSYVPKMMRRMLRADACARWHREASCKRKDWWHAAGDESHHYHIYHRWSVRRFGLHALAGTRFSQARAALRVRRH